MAATQNVKNGDSADLAAVTATSFTGPLTGNVTGNVTGNITGGIVEPLVAVTADGAISVPSVNTTYFITKAGVAAMTLVDPTATTHDNLQLTFISVTANAHTLSNGAGSGFNGGGAGSDVGTFGAAKGNNIVIRAYQGDWYVVSSVNVTLA